jgi:tetratricopeptide (TPR) repeat protein
MKLLNFLIACLSRLILLPVILFIFVSNLYGQLPDDLFNEANKLYQEHRFLESIEIYNKILSQGYESSSLYYNLGNAYFKAGSLGRAILNYEKGLKLSPGDDDITYNLKIANARTIDKIAELPRLFIVEWWELLIISFSTSGWSLITALVFWVFLASIGLFYFAKKTNVQRISLMIGSISLALLIIAAVILVSRYNHEAITNYGVLTEEIYSVKGAPDYKSNDIFVIHEGIKFKVEDYVAEWFKIRLADGKVGWIPKNVFEQI